MGTVLSDETRKRIDAKNYKAMLSLWRNAPSSHPYFQPGPVFDYFQSRMQTLRAEVGDAGHTQASKSIGWD